MNHKQQPPVPITELAAFFLENELKSLTGELIIFF